MRMIQTIMRKYNVSARCLFGNVCADALANRGSEVAEVSGQDSVTVLWHYSLVRRIQARAVVIMSSVLERRSIAPTRQKRPREPKPTRDALVLQSSHRFTYNGRTLQCCRCHQVSPANPQSVKQWLRTPCVPNHALIRTLHVGTTKPTDVPREQRIVVCRQTIHASHILAVYRGLYFCTRCGYHGSKKIQKLTSECKGMDSKKAIARVIALRQGSLPSGLACWPTDSQRQQILAHTDS